MFRGVTEGGHFDAHAVEEREVARELVGPDVPIMAPLDLHTNLSQQMMEECDAFVGYKEYPHTDTPETGAQALQMLVSTLRGEITGIPRERYAERAGRGRNLAVVLAERGEDADHRPHAARDVGERLDVATFVRIANCIAARGAPPA